MNIFNPNNQSFNYSENLKPLFEAMKQGKRIKSVTCMRGTMNADNPSRDFKIKDFIAVDYSVAAGRLDGVDCDLVETQARKKDFYMNWVRSFEL